MNRYPPRPLLILPLLILATLALTAAVLALLAGPQPLFTDNIAATGPSPDVTAMEQALLDHLNAATSTIDVALYDFNRASVRDALIAAAGRGVTVRVVTDDEAYADPDYAPHFQALEAAGIGVVNDNRSSIMHNKFLVIDGAVVWTGSTNLTDRGFTYNHNNSLVFTSTLLADIYTLEFEEMFVAGLFGTAKSDNVTHTLDYNGIPLEVYFSPTDDALPELLAEVAGAAESIHFGIFFFTDASLRDALIARQQAGVAVSGVWDRLGASNTYSQDETLCAAGVPIKIEDLGGLLHHKFLILDATGANPVVITGSMNWTGAGAGSNDENTLIIHDAAVAQAYLAAYQELYDALGPETLCETGGGGFLAYLPLVLRPVAQPTPTATPTLPPGPLPTATPTATPSATPEPGGGQVVIDDVFYDGAGSSEPDEYVGIRNASSQSVNLGGWTLRDEANRVFTFPAFTMTPGQMCRVYTNEEHPEWCGFNYGSGSAIWNNGGDCATLQDGNGAVVDTYCYP